MEGMSESVSLMAGDEVRGGAASEVCEVSAKCRLFIPRMPRGIKSNIETLVTDSWAGSPWSGADKSLLRRHSSCRGPIISAPLHTV